MSVEISKHVQADVGISSYVTILLFAYVPSAFVFTGCMSSVGGGGRVLSIQIEYLEYTRFPFASHNDPESVGTTTTRRMAGIEWSTQKVNNLSELLLFYVYLDGVSELNDGMTD